MRLTVRFLVDQLRTRLTRDAAIAARAGQQAKEAAQHSATAMEKRQDGRTLIEYGNLAHAQGLRTDQARAALQTLDAFAARSSPRLAAEPAIGLGAIIDAASEDEEGFYARTFVMLPVGAGEQLTGPGGDGIITVITPSSPVGRAMLGKRAGDVAEVVVRGEPIDWEILEVAG